MTPEVERELAVLGLTGGLCPTTGLPFGVCLWLSLLENMLSWIHCTRGWASKMGRGGSPSVPPVALCNNEIPVGVQWCWHTK